MSAKVPASRNEHAAVEVLTEQDWAFYRLFCRYNNGARAYRETKGGRLKESACQVGASKWLRRIRENSDYQRRLDEAGLGDETLFRDIHALRRAKQTKFITVGTVINERVTTDNRTRLGAAQLLARLQGRDIQKGEIAVRGEHVVILLPAEMGEDEWQRSVNQQHDGNGHRNGKRRRLPPAS